MCHIGFEFSCNESQVATSHKDEYEKLNKELKKIEPESESVLSKSYTDKVQFYHSITFFELYYVLIHL